MIVEIISRGIKPRFKVDSRHPYDVIRDIQSGVSSNNFSTSSSIVAEHVIQSLCNDTNNIESVIWNGVEYGAINISIVSQDIYSDYCNCFDVIDDEFLGDL